NRAGAAGASRRDERQNRAGRSLDLGAILLICIRRIQGEKPHETKYSQDDRIGILCAGPCPERGPARASTGRQESVSHHAPTRSIPDGPRCGDCDVPQRRPELRFERGQGASSWTAWLRKGRGWEERFRVPGVTIMGFTEKQSGF